MKKKLLNIWLVTFFSNSIITIILLILIKPITIEELLNILPITIFLSLLITIYLGFLMAMLISIGIVFVTFIKSCVKKYKRKNNEPNDLE